MIHPNGSIPLRRRSAWSAAASWTGVVSASVTISTRVKAASRSRMSGVVIRPCIPLDVRITSRWYAPVRSRSIKVCPVGAVSTTTYSFSAASQQVRERLKHGQLFGAG